MPKDEKVDNKVSRIIKLEERKEKNSKIIQQTNQRNLMSKTEISVWLSTKTSAQVPPHVLRNSTES